MKPEFDVLVEHLLAGNIFLEEAIELLETLSATLTPQVHDEMLSRSEHLAAALRPRLLALVPADRVKPAAGNEVP